MDAVTNIVGLVLFLSSVALIRGRMALTSINRHPLRGGLVFFLRWGVTTGLLTFTRLIILGR
jgi:hypothetical protein